MGVRIVTVNQSVAELVKKNGGYCPGKTERTFDTRCMCKDFRDQEEGLCHCGRYMKVVDKDG